MSSDTRIVLLCTLELYSMELVRFHGKGGAIDVYMFTSFQEGRIKKHMGKAKTYSLLSHVDRLFLLSVFLARECCCCCCCVSHSIMSNSL